MRQLSGIKVFLFGFLYNVALFLFVNLFFGFEQWNRGFKFVFMLLMFLSFSIFLNKGYFDKFLSKKDWIAYRLEMNEMNRIFKYLIASIIMGITVFFAVYYTKGEYNYMAFPIAFILNVPIYFGKKNLNQ